MSFGMSWEARVWALVFALGGVSAWVGGWSAVVGAVAMGSACAAAVRLKRWTLGAIAAGRRTVGAVVYGMGSLGLMGLPLLMLRWGIDPVGILLGVSAIPGASLWTALVGR